MSTFWILAALLAVTAALFVAVPLWRRTAPRAGSAGEPALAVYRDQLGELAQERDAGRLAETQYLRARAELERRLVEEVPAAQPDSTPAASVASRGSRAAALAALVALPLAAVLLYVALGHPDAVRPAAAEAGHGLGQRQLDELVARLGARLERNPEDARGWAMLARAQAVLGRFDQASQGYARAVALQPDDAQLLADYADAFAMAQGGRLAGEPEQLIARALRADPVNAKALALAGSAAFEQQDYPQAVAFWERLRSAVPPDSEFGASVQQNIEEARLLAQRQRGAAPATAVRPQPAQAQRALQTAR